MADFKESLGYQKQLLKILQEITVEILEPEVATFGYVCGKYGANCLRILNKETNKIHIIKEDTLKEDRLKYYFMNFAAFFKEIERVNYTMFF